MRARPRPPARPLPASLLPCFPDLCLRRAVPQFELYVSPPRAVLKAASSLSDAGLVPAALVYVSWREVPPAGERRGERRAQPPSCVRFLCLPTPHAHHTLDVSSLFSQGIYAEETPLGGERVLVRIFVFSPGECWSRLSQAPCLLPPVWKQPTSRFAHTPTPPCVLPITPPNVLFFLSGEAEGGYLKPDVTSGPTGAGAGTAAAAARPVGVALDGDRKGVEESKRGGGRGGGNRLGGGSSGGGSGGSGGGKRTGKPSWLKIN